MYSFQNVCLVLVQLCLIFCQMGRIGSDILQDSFSMIPSNVYFNQSLHSERSSMIDDGPYESLRKYQDFRSGRYLATKFWNQSVQYIIPLVTFSFPPVQDQGSSIELVHQAIYALISLLAFIAAFTWPFMVTDPLNSMSVGRGMNSVQWLIDPVLADEIGMNKDKCLEKTICQAYESPEKYGLLSTILRIFYERPVMDNLQGIGQRNGAYRSFLKKGVKRKCAENYKCFFDVLDLTHYFFSWWQISNSNCSYTHDNCIS